MAHILQKNYSSFKGLDTRSNKLLQDPNSFREGTRNNRYDFQDQVMPANGFQQRAISSFVNLGDIEYKYTDLDTGQEKSQHLCVGDDGNLYKKNFHYLYFSSFGTASKYSFYYDEIKDLFKFKLDSYAEISVSDTMTLSQLATAITGLGAAAHVVDDDGNTVASTELAVHMDVAIGKILLNLNKPLNAQFWSVIFYPSQGLASDVVPFPTSLNFNSSSLYEGISFQNTNNSCFIADGGFPMKYDGHSVVRAGMPKVLKELPTKTTNVSGYSLTAGTDMTIDGSTLPGTIVNDSTALIIIGTTAGLVVGSYISGIGIQAGTTIVSIDSTTTLTMSLPAVGAGFGLIIFYGGLPAGTHKYIFQLANVDFQSIAIYGTYELINSASLEITLSGGANIIRIDYKQIFEPNFAVFSCIVDGDQGIPTAGGTFNVQTGHNIKPGMLLRIPLNNAEIALTGFSLLQTKVSAVTSTTITVEKGYTPSGPYTYPFYDGSTHSTILINNEILNGGFIQGLYANEIGSPNTNFPLCPLVNFGAYLRVYRTIVDTDNFYRLIDMPLSSYTAGVFFDIYQDNPTGTVYELSRLSILDAESGGELPRACKYLTLWQGKLVQAGRPIDTALKDNAYPTSISSNALQNSWGSDDTTYLGYLYTEVHLCDYQSFYWSDGLEGFPQDGLNELKIETKFDDQITGISPNKEVFFAFKQRSTAVVSGDLIGTLNVEVLEDDIGCASHRSIQNVRGALVWLDGTNGFYLCVAGRLPQNIGFAISDYEKINLLGLDFSKAVSANYRKESLYICTVQNQTFVFDYAADGTLQRGCWYLWDRFTVNSYLLLDDELYMNTGNILWKMKVTNTKYDDTDQKAAIPFEIVTSWFSAGAPTIDKDFHNLWINSIQGGFYLDVDQYANFLPDKISTQPNVPFIKIDCGKLFIKQPIKADISKLSAISFGLRNNQKNRYLKLQGYEIEFSVDFDQGEPKR